jgi:acetyl-CoA carboxylase biotin carboxyl carrier protein
MWKDRLKEVIYILENSNINEIEVRFWFRKIKVTKAPPIINADLDTLSKKTTIEEKERSIKVEEKEDIQAIANLFTVRSPMPGTFYTASEPGTKPFVNIGSKINEGDVICIIEAMKIMNEIQSEKNGTIKEILIKDGNPIEFDQPLFVIDCSE